MSTKAPNPVDKYVGSRVRMRRIMLRMSQAKLGAAVGPTFQQRQKHRKGHNRAGASRTRTITDHTRKGREEGATGDGFGWQHRTGRIGMPSRSRCDGDARAFLGQQSRACKADAAATAGDE